MIVNGRSRGGGRALAQYLLKHGENEHVELLYVDGQAKLDEKDFRNLLGDFSLTEKLTRSRKGIYHVTINPPPEFSRQMTKEEWLQSAEILAEELGMSGQRMAIVLHQKHGRQHIHCAFERYNHETGKAIHLSHNYRKHLKAGLRMAEAFDLKPVQERNPKREPMKETLTRIWNETGDAPTFIREAKRHGYLLSKGHDRKPFLVIDDSGRSFNLVRHLSDIKTGQVRARLKGVVLMEEREAVAFVRNQQSVTAKQTVPRQQSDRQAFLETLKQAKAKQQTHKPRMH